MSTSPMIVPDKPDIKSLSFRTILGEQDADALYAVHAGRIAHDKVDLSLHHEDFPSRDGLRNELSQAVAAGAQDQWLVAQINERVFGYSQFASWPEEDGMWVYFIGGWVLPEWRGQGIGTAWRRRGLGRALLIRALRDVRERGEEAIWLDTYAEYPTRAVDLYRSLGFYVSKEFPRY